ncbi:MAG: hypothetical protein WCR36_06350 [Bacteroidaceae bacterium]
MSHTKEILLMWLLCSGGGFWLYSTESLITGNIGFLIYFILVIPVGFIFGSYISYKEFKGGTNLKQTVCVDDVICPYCGFKFDGRNATNADMDCQSVTCSKCGKEMDIMISVEYTATTIDD